MINCSKCGAAVKEEKAFCQNCGNPMDAAMRQRDEPMPDFSATIIEPPRRTAQPFVPPTPPPPAEVKPAATETAPAAPPPPTPAPAAQPTARVAAATAAAVPSPPVAPPPVAPPVAPPLPATGRKTARKIGIGFVLLLLFLMFAAFVIALWFD